MARAANENVEGAASPYAVQAFKKAAQLKPDSAIVHYDLAITYITLKEREAALKEHAILKELSPQLAEKLEESLATLEKQKGVLSIPQK